MLRDKLMGLRLGIRTTTDDENYSVDDTCRYSYEWDYENDCSTYYTENPIKLNGTCAVEVILENLEEMSDEEIMEQLRKVSCNYVGEQVILIGGHYAEYGSDESEIIIEGAEVLAVIE